MNYQLIASISVAAYLLLALILRPALLRWRTGKWGFNGVSGPAGSLGWWGGLSFIASLVLIPVALSLESRSETFAIPGLVVMAAGFALTILAQSGLGASWRIGVDETERTGLVTTGLYACVRNPIFSGMILFALGVVLVWPNSVSVISLALLVLGIELQVRFIEEPYLRRVHGEAWQRWAGRVGRFVPWLG